MSLDERAFRRLLRWYPRSWRHENGAVLLSTLIDAAEHEQRARPTIAEHRAAFVHGTAARLTRRTAIVLAFLALGGATVGGMLSIWAPTSGGGMLPVLLSGIVPALASLALLCVLREHGRLGDGDTLATAALAVTAFSLNVLTAASWSLGFDAADTGQPVEGLAAAWLPLFAAAVLTGAAAIALLVDALLSRSAMPHVARIALAVLTGVVSAPVLGYGTISPLTSALLAVGVGVIAVWPGSLRTLGTPPGRAGGRLSAVRRIADPADARTTARLLALIALAASAIGLVYAFTGAHWSPGAADGTVAMGQGIAILLLSGIPLVSSLGLRETATAGIRPLRWGPWALVALGLGCGALGYVESPSQTGMPLGFHVGAIVIGGAIAWSIIVRVPFSRTGAVLLGGFTGALYAAYAGVMLLPLLGFAVPIVAVVVAVRPTRDRLRDQRTEPVAASG
ncbi:hypothetical protein [Microbacterium sp. CJ88]|uniref:hypothetical protein n=1 Tax=Microbacterium sp. CJ88 TaxID=3445672 RepID=UPI003F65D84A